MATQGPGNPGVMVDDAGAGAVAWQNPSNVVTNNGVYADATAGDGEQDSHYIKATNFGFTIPGSATINGITVEMDRQSSGADVIDAHARIVKADGSHGSTNKALGGVWPGGDAYATYGGSSDLWGETWTPANINDVDFGFLIAATMSAFITAYVDHIRITITYTETPVNVNPAVITGTAQSGQTLTLTDGDGSEDWTGETSIARQWQTATNAGFTTGVTDLGGATATTYVLTTGEVGKWVRCRVRATNASGDTDSNSNIIGPINAAGGGAAERMGQVPI